VFFLLMKERVPVETTKHIFKKRSLYQQAAQKKKVAAQAEAQESPAPASAPMTWADRLAVLKELNAEKGQATTVKITLIGRPGRIVERGTHAQLLAQGGLYARLYREQFQDDSGIGRAPIEGNGHEPAIVGAAATLGTAPEHR